MSVTITGSPTITVNGRSHFLKPCVADSLGGGVYNYYAQPGPTDGVNPRPSPPGPAARSPIGLSNTYAYKDYPAPSSGFPAGTAAFNIAGTQDGTYGGYWLTWLGTGVMGPSGAGTRGTQAAGTCICGIPALTLNGAPSYTNPSGSIFQTPLIAVCKILLGGGGVGGPSLQLESQPQPLDMGSPSFDFNPFARVHVYAVGTGTAIPGAVVDVGIRYSDGTTFQIASGTTDSTGYTTPVSADFWLGKGGAAVTTGDFTRSYATTTDRYYYAKVTLPNGVVLDNSLAYPATYSMAIASIGLGGIGYSGLLRYNDVDTYTAAPLILTGGGSSLPGGWVGSFWDAAHAAEFGLAIQGNYTTAPGTGKKPTFGADLAQSHADLRIYRVKETSGGAGTLTVDVWQGVSGLAGAPGRSTVLTDAGGGSRAGAAPSLFIWSESGIERLFYRRPDGQIVTADSIDGLYILGAEVAGLFAETGGYPRGIIDTSTGISYVAAGIPSAGTSPTTSDVRIVRLNPQRALMTWVGGATEKLIVTAATGIGPPSLTLSRTDGVQSLLVIFGDRRWLSLDGGENWTEQT